MEHKIWKGACGMCPGTGATDTYRNSQGTTACRAVIEASATETCMGEAWCSVAGKRQGW